MWAPLPQPRLRSKAQWALAVPRPCPTQNKHTCKCFQKQAKAEPQSRWGPGWKAPLTLRPKQQNPDPGHLHRWGRGPGWARLLGWFLTTLPPGPGPRPRPRPLPAAGPACAAARPRVTRHPGHIPENCLVEGALRVGGGQVQPPQAAPGTLGVGFTGHSGTKPGAQALGPPSLQLQPQDPSQPICHQSFVPAVPRTGTAQPMTARTSAHEGPWETPLTGQTWVPLPHRLRPPEGQRGCSDCGEEPQHVPRLQEPSMPASTSPAGPGPQGGSPVEGRPWEEPQGVPWGTGVTRWVLLTHTISHKHGHADSSRHIDTHRDRDAQRHT